MTLVFSLLYSLNMYFQSFGAVSIIKVKAFWFHVRERGIFGAIFGALISLGSYLAFDWGQAIVNASKNSAVPGDTLHSMFQAVFNVESGATAAVWLVYFIPAGILLAWAVLDFFLIRDTPAHAGLEDFDTHDASSGEMHIEHSIMDLLKRVFTNPILVMVALVELANGVVRNGVVQWYKPFVEQNPLIGSALFHDHWGLFLFLSGISGGFVAGHVSDKYFHSRRGPPVAISGALLILFLILLGATLFSSPFGLGVSAVAISFLTIAIHSLMSGTAAADFGGRKATATAAGVTDAFVYLGAAVQSFALGHLLKHGWFYWPAFLVPFAIAGVLLAVKMWQSLPEATRRYLLVVEKVSVTVADNSAQATATLELEEVRST
jgi:OPA family glycerol-3-phosphate transporter-like MFS transporter